MGNGPNTDKNANRNPILNNKLKAITVQMRMPSSVSNQVLHAKRKALPPIVEIADHKMGLPTMNTARWIFTLLSLIAELWYA